MADSEAQKGEAPMAARREPQHEPAEEEHDPVLAALLAAPPDDEPLTPEEEAAIEEAYAALDRGDVVSGEKVRRDLGLR